MAAACRRANRPAEAVRLIAATKGVPPERVAEAVAAGVELLGENRIQEALPKIAALGARVGPEQWHFIGRLQRNKARQASGRFGLIHSVDSLELAEALDRRAAQIGADQAILIQVKLADEADKGGVAPEALEGLADAVARLPRLRLRGLMTLPPPAQPEASRRYFAELARLAARLRARGHGANELSMGMSDDFEVAIEAGATLVRIGTALFGPRPRQG
jgi:pyridoxal phosphate enzyme (YggS family)